MFQLLHDYSATYYPNAHSASFSSKIGMVYTFAIWNSSSLVACTLHLLCPWPASALSSFLLHYSVQVSVISFS
jgi:hypothetical protein